MTSRRKGRNLVMMLKNDDFFFLFDLHHPVHSYYSVCTYPIVVVTLRSWGLINKSNMFPREKKKNKVRVSMLFRNYSICLFGNSIFKTRLLQFIEKNVGDYTKGARSRTGCTEESGLFILSKLNTISRGRSVLCSVQGTKRPSLAIVGAIYRLE